MTSLYMFLVLTIPFSGILLFGGIIRLPFYRFPTGYAFTEPTWNIAGGSAILLSLLTITFSALFTAGFGEKKVIFKLSNYFFILSSCFFFLRFVQVLVGLSYEYGV